jgi:hypothetical protein
MTTDLTERQNTVPAEVAMERNRFTRPGFIAAAGVVALIGTATFAFVVFPPGHHKPTTRMAGTTGTPAAAPVARPTTDSVCGLLPGDQAVPTTAPANTKWELVGTTAAPTAPGIGPGSKSWLRSCFAHSPTGALYALVNYLALTDDPRTYAAAIRQLVASGPARDAAIAKSTAPIPVDPAARVQVAGFAYLNYSPTDAVVDLVSRATPAAGSTSYVHGTVALRWEGGDWKVVPGPDGSPLRLARVLSDLDGYVLWSGA